MTKKARCIANLSDQSEMTARIWLNYDDTQRQLLYQWIGFKNSRAAHRHVAAFGLVSARKRDAAAGANTRPNSGQIAPSVALKARGLSAIRTPH